jgi:AmmeMemoRadiSam system protein B
MEKEKVRIRKPAFAGSFYPSTKQEIQAFFQRFEEQLKEEELVTDTVGPRISGLIVPHAGWVYSGKTAYAAHRLLQKIKPEKIALLGPSHRALFHTAYRDPNDFWESPLGRTSVIHDQRFPVHPSVHDDEHSLEVQLPFIQYFSPESCLLPLVVGHISHAQAEEFAELSDFYFLIISTDLSHYHPLDEARHIDSLSIRNIENLKDSDVDACGINPLRVAFAFMRRRGLRPHLIDYSTSAEAFGDASAVVGYAGFWF